VTRDTLIDFFRDLARARGPFLVYDDGFRTRAYTYEEVGTGARAFAARLRVLGLQKGDKVIFWSENRPEWIIAFWGCLLGGIVVVPIDYRASPDFLTRVSRIVSARLIVIGQEVPPFDARDAPVWRLHELQWNDGPAEVEASTSCLSATCSARRWPPSSRRCSPASWYSCAGTTRLRLRR